MHKIVVIDTVLQVSYVEFSPDEKYVLSYSSREPTNPQEKAALLVNVFDSQTGAKLRKFEGSIEEFAVGSAAMGDGSLKWPIFKWAASGCALTLLHSACTRQPQLHLTACGDLAGGGLSLVDGWPGRGLAFGGSSSTQL